MATGISFLYQWDLGSRSILNPGINILSVTSQADGDFDKSNLTTDSLRHVWRSASILSWQEIVIQADIASQIDTFAILGHNFSEDAVVQVQANVDNNFAAPPFSVTIPWAKLNMVLCQDFEEEYEFYKIRVLDPTNPCGYIEIGRIVGGRAFTFMDGEDITDDFTIDWSDKAKRMDSEGFSRFSNETVKVRSLQARFMKLRTITGSNTNFLGWRRMMETVGITRPLLVILDRTDPARLALWGLFSRIPAESYTINGFMNQNFSIDEEF